MKKEMRGRVTLINFFAFSFFKGLKGRSNLSIKWGQAWPRGYQISSNLKGPQQFPFSGVPLRFLRKSLGWVVVDPNLFKLKLAATDASGERETNIVPGGRIASHLHPGSGVQNLGEIWNFHAISGTLGWEVRVNILIDKNNFCRSIAYYQRL